MNTAFVSKKSINISDNGISAFIEHELNSKKINIILKIDLDKNTMEFIFNNSRINIFKDKDENKIKAFKIIASYIITQIGNNNFVTENIKKLAKRLEQIMDKLK